jgi:small subunit ribosomal protein S21
MVDAPAIDPYTPGLERVGMSRPYGPPSGPPFEVQVEVFGARMVKLTVRERESIQEAVRRFRKLVERSGIKKEMRRREFFEKPSETKRRARLRAERRTKRNRLLGV